MQAQEFVPALWSVGQRMRKATRGSVEHAVAEGRIIRTHVLRPTWHFVAPGDLRWMLALTAPRVHARIATYHQQWGVDDDLVARSRRVIERALMGGTHLTRREVGARLEADGVGVAGQALGAVMMHLELEAVVCSGAPKGKQQTYALVEERVPAAPVLSRDEALAELARRYFRSHGPATARDFAWWSGLLMADVRRGLEMLGGEIGSAESDGRTYWGVDLGRRVPASPGAVDLIQTYDEFGIAYSESRDVLGAGTEGAEGGPEPFTAAVLLDGLFVGTWKAAIGKDAVVVELRSGRRLSDDGPGLVEEAVAGYGQFHGLPARLVRSPADS
jgi:hypothetical protein